MWSLKKDEPLEIALLERNHLLAFLSQEVNLDPPLTLLRLRRPDLRFVLRGMMLPGVRSLWYTICKKKIREFNSKLSIFKAP